MITKNIVNIKDMITFVDFLKKVYRHIKNTPNGKKNVKDKNINQFFL